MPAGAPFTPFPLRQRRVLVVDSGPMARLSALGRLRGMAVDRLAPAELSVEALGEIRPACVILALFDDQSDALDLLAWLARQRFGGRVIVLSPPLPRRRVVERELALAGPGLRLWLVQARDLGMDRSVAH